MVVRKRTLVYFHWVELTCLWVNPLSTLGKWVGFTEETLSTLYQQQPLFGGMNLS